MSLSLSWVGNPIKNLILFLQPFTLSFDRLIVKRIDLKWIITKTLEIQMIIIRLFLSSYRWSTKMYLWVFSTHSLDSFSWLFSCGSERCISRSSRLLRYITMNTHISTYSVWRWLFINSNLRNNLYLGRCSIPGSLGERSSSRLVKLLQR